jgi:hypothetical protein
MPLTQVQGGMILASGQSIPKAALPTGSVLQVVQGTTSTQTTGTNTWIDTALSVSITPVSSSSRILIIVNQNYSLSQLSSNSFGGLRLLRGSTVIFTGGPVDSGGPYMLGTSAGGSTSNSSYNYVTFLYIDSPSTTANTTYKTQQRSYNAGTTITTQLNDSVNSGISNITAMEIAS